MPDLPAVPPEAYEAAEAERQKHFFADLAACRCGFLPQAGADWDAHLTRVAVDAAAPFLVAEGRRQAAEAIRAEYATGNKPLPAELKAVHRPGVIAEWAARIAEGN